jgi:hypothetical protein
VDWGDLNKPALIDVMALSDDLQGLARSLEVGTIVGMAL